MLIDKEDCKLEYQTTGVPKCTLCNLQHWRCKEPKYTNCYNLNKCNEIQCNYCKQNNKVCTCSLPTEQAAYNEINKDILYICRQYEVTGSGKLYAQMYMQFNIRQILKSIKTIFNDDSIYLPTFLARNLEQNRENI